VDAEYETNGSPSRSVTEARKLFSAWVSPDNLGENGGGNQSLKRRPVAKL